MTKIAILLLFLLPSCAVRWNYPPKDPQTVAASVMDSTDQFSGQRNIATPAYHFSEPNLGTIETWWLEWRGDAAGSSLVLRICSDCDRGTTRCLAMGGRELPISRAVEMHGGIVFEVLTIAIPEEVYRSEAKDGIDLRAYGMASLDIWLPKPVLEGFAAAIEQRGCRLFPANG